MNKKTLIILIVPILLFGCTRNLKDANQPQMTEIEILKNEQDFGILQIGEQVEGYFLVKNTGDEDLIYKSIIPDCSCTLVSKGNDTVHKGATDTLRFVLNTEGKESGAFKKYLRIITNTKPDLHKFTIKAMLE